MILFYSILSYFYLHKKMEQLLEQMNAQIKNFYTDKHNSEHQSVHHTKKSLIQSINQRGDDNLMLEPDLDDLGTD